MHADSTYRQLLQDNDHLQQFLDNGDFALFEHPESWDVWKDPAFREWLEPRFTNRLNRELLSCVKEKGFQSMKKLRTFRESGFPIPDDIRKSAYAGTIAYFRELLDRGEREAAQAFEEGKNDILKSQIREMLAVHYVNVLKVLPDEIFRSVVDRYGRIAAQVIDQARDRHRNLSKFDRDTLWLLRNAADVYLLKDPGNEEMKKLAEDIRSDMYRKSGTGGRNRIADVIILLFIIAFFIFRFKACSRYILNN